VWQFGGSLLKPLATQCLIFEREKERRSLDTYARGYKKYRQRQERRKRRNRQRHGRQQRRCSAVRCPMVEQSGLGSGSLSPLTA
jgi:hypothetical protein